MELFDLLRSSISGEKISDTVREMLSIEKLHNFFKISNTHDVSHLLALGIKQNELTEKIDIDIDKCVFKAVYRHERTKHAFTNLCDALEKSQIPFIPLKGSVIRKYYPEPWMRTSCDIDILVSEADSQKAMELLINEYGYSYQRKGSHDISLYSHGKIHVELHYDLIENGRANNSAKILTTVWDTAVLREGSQYWYEMPDEMFYFYHIAHMAKHFVEGGCGIRSFIDLWILDSIHQENFEKRNELLAKADLLIFANSLRRLCKIWFENGEHDHVSRQMEDYVLRGGVYGNHENRIMVQQQKKGGRLRYVLSKIFIPYDVIKFHYPVLQKHRWLTPFMQVRRWCKLIFWGHLKRTARELRYNNSISSEQAKSMQTFLDNIGL